MKCVVRSALGDVISSLLAKKDHIPYRNSKLTMYNHTHVLSIQFSNVPVSFYICLKNRLLKDSLGGDSKTMMIVQVSPCQGHVLTFLQLKNDSMKRNLYLMRAFLCILLL